MTHRGAVSIRVLVIDDQRTMRDIIRHLLGQVGIHDIEEAENGEEAVDLICRPGFVQPDIIICDLHMKKMDGMEFCNKMRL
ncbi:MAG: response regulator [Proteobacteria bacterium]|nr:response regulator [Pseudomonadota bacterium]